MRRDEKHKRSLKLKEKMLRLKADTIREDGRLERHCEHGVGHAVGHIKDLMEKENWVWAHGCDGCCSTWGKDDEGSGS